MSGERVLAIDQGTHATRALLFDDRGRAVAQAGVPVELQRLSRTEVEQSPRQLQQSLRTVIAKVLASPAAGPVTAAGLATQRSSVLAWDRDSGEPLSPVVSWQDRRATGICETLAGHDARIGQLTGLRLSPHYGAGKLHWLLAHSAPVAQALANGSLAMGPLAGYLLQHLLTGCPTVVDAANASRTLLWDLRTRDWNDELLALFGIPRSVLPACRPICADYGMSSHGGIPLRAVNGDQTAALYARGQPPENTVMVNIGTGAFALLPVADPTRRPAGLLAGISCSDASTGRYCLEGTVNGAGAALDWAGRLFGKTAWEDRLPGWLDAVGDPPLFMNTVGGLGAPWWRAGPAPHFVGGKPAPAAGMVAVAESIVFLLQVNVALLRESNPRVECLRISGGLAQLDGLCRRLASLSGLPVQRPAQVEGTARGIAWQAAGCPDGWQATGGGDTFEPREDKALAARYEAFVRHLESLR
ncbi:MAG: FGGY family carbohydrate kinase [Gammaproteobacteria bacterium]|jgi:glycerol kinase